MEAVRRSVDHRNRHSDVTLTRQHLAPILKLLKSPLSSINLCEYSFLVHQHAMGVLDLDQVKPTITKRAAATTTAECTSPYTYEKVFCRNGWAALGCFTADPCTDDGGATSSE